MFVRKSNREEREGIFSQGKEADKCKRKGLDPSIFIDAEGIRVENAGRGLAAKGELRQIDPDGETTLVDTFTRLHPGNVYHYPSPDRPDFKVPKDGEKIRMRLVYYDIDDRKYEWEDDVYFIGEKVEAS